MRGKKFKSYTAKDRKKDLELFAKTGMHPDIDAARRKAREDTVLALPDSETGPGRPRTFVDLSIGKRLLGVARRLAASTQPPLHTRTHSQIQVSVPPLPVAPLREWRRSLHVLWLLGATLPQDILGGLCDRGCGS